MGLDDLKDNFSEFIDTITDRFEKVKEDVNDLVDSKRSKKWQKVSSKTFRHCVCSEKLLPNLGLLEQT